jgi:hypothetical protein
MKIDFSYLETISDGDHEFIKQFISTFESTYVSLTKKMKRPTGQISPPIKTLSKNVGYRVC